MATVVVGEASETDSEDEILPENKGLKQKENSHLSNTENSNTGNLLSQTGSSSETKYTSLLHQKLRENNKKLCVDIETFVRSTTDEAVKNINNVDQHLLKSQVTLQGAVNSLKNVSLNSLHIKNQLHSILSDNFLSNISSLSK